ncbi:MAG: hypothetical protein JOZ29_10950 [Deltaproteobacteria bacterium]|nr:hypothetical protein [Deltaproteobacteria bacterium]
MRSQSNRPCDLISIVHQQAGADEVELVFLEAPQDECGIVQQLERLAREFVDTAAKI